MLTPTQITRHPNIFPVLRQQARTFLDIERSSPRIAGIFGTQQRYLLAQLALAMAFTNPQGTLLTTHYLDAVVAAGISSRNTAHDFIREMTRYGLTFTVPDGEDKRARPLGVSEAPIQMIGVWTTVHLATLDMLDGGRRVGAFEADPAFLKKMHPLVVTSIMKSQKSVRPEGTFSLFTWMNDGGLVMDGMIATIEDTPTEGGRFLTAITSFDALAEPLRITRTHLSRKMAIAERDGSVGWEGKRGASRLWLSRDFLGEYVDYQADKLSLIDRAFDTAKA